MERSRVTRSRSRPPRARTPSSTRARWRATRSSSRASAMAEAVRPRSSRPRERSSSRRLYQQNGGARLGSAVFVFGFVVLRWLARRAQCTIRHHEALPVFPREHRVGLLVGLEALGLRIDLQRRTHLEAAEVGDVVVLHVLDHPVEGLLLVLVEVGRALAG